MDDATKNPLPERLGLEESFEQYLKRCGSPKCECARTTAPDPYGVQRAYYCAQSVIYGKWRG